MSRVQVPSLTRGEPCSVALRGRLPGAGSSLYWGAEPPTPPTVWGSPCLPAGPHGAGGLACRRHSFALCPVPFGAFVALPALGSLPRCPARAFLRPSRHDLAGLFVTVLHARCPSACLARPTVASLASSMGLPSVRSVRVSCG